MGFIKPPDNSEAFSRVRSLRFLGSNSYLITAVVAGVRNRFIPGKLHWSVGDRGEILVFRFLTSSPVTVINIDVMEVRFMP